MTSEEKKAENQKQTRLNKIVAQALDNALKNGYDDFVKQSTIATVAHDLMDLDADVEKLDPTHFQVKRAVRLWRRVNKEKLK